MSSTSPFMGAGWRTSSYTNASGGNCVEVCHVRGLVGIRDTKNRDGGTLAVSDTAFTSLVTAIKNRRLG